MDITDPALFSILLTFWLISHNHPLATNPGNQFNRTKIQVLTL